MSQHRGRADDQQGPQVMVSHLGDPPQPLLASARRLSGRETQEGRELATRSEHRRIGDAGGQGAGGERADARDGRQANADLVRSMLFQHLAVEMFDLALQCAQLIGQGNQGFPRQVRKALVSIVGQNFQQGRQMTRTGGADQAKLRKMAA